MTFLDVMASGFGAIIMIYLLVNHSVDESITRVSASLTAEVTMLEEDIQDGVRNLVQLRNALATITDRVASARQQARQISAESKTVEAKTPPKPDPVNETDKAAQAKTEITALEAKVKELRDKSSGQFGGSNARAWPISILVSPTHARRRAMSCSSSRLPGASM